MEFYARVSQMSIATSAVPKGEREITKMFKEIQHILKTCRNYIIEITFPLVDIKGNTTVDKLQTSNLKGVAFVPQAVAPRADGLPRLRLLRRLLLGRRQFPEVCARPPVWRFGPQHQSFYKWHVSYWFPSLLGFLKSPMDFNGPWADRLGSIDMSKQILMILTLDWSYELHWPMI